MDKALEPWVGFNLVKGVGPARLRSLQAKFGNLADAWQAPIADLQAAGLPNRLAQTVEQVRQSDQLEVAMQRLAAIGAQVITWDDSRYPRRLKDIDQSPPVLYLRGALPEEPLLAVALVGTRRVTAYGRQVTGELAQMLARNGVCVISGLARGVDSIAHQAALKAGGLTLAVLGCGVDVIYPSEHQALAQQIIAQGALISDYPPGTPPEAGNFPPRNRIISGLAQVVVVVEAGEKSGALITAAFAAEQGRQLYAVPGQVYAPQSRGTNRLIQEGACILADPRDLLEALNLTHSVEKRQARTILPADATEARLYSLLSQQPQHVDELGLQSGLPIEAVSAALTMMELKGLARQVGNMHYVAVYEQEEEYFA